MKSLINSNVFSLREECPKLTLSVPLLAICLLQGVPLLKTTAVEHCFPSSGASPMGGCNRHCPWWVHVFSVRQEFFCCHQSFCCLLCSADVWCSSGFSIRSFFLIAQVLPLFLNETGHVFSQLYRRCSAVLLLWTRWLLWSLFIATKDWIAVIENFHQLNPDTKDALW